MAARRTSAPLARDAPEDASLPTKAVWFATEAFGKAAALVRPPVEEDDDEQAPPAPKSIDEAVERLARDYEGTPTDPRPYFLTGEMGLASNTLRLSAARSLSRWRARGLRCF